MGNKGKGPGSGKVAKSWQKTYTKSRTKTRKVKCRYCSATEVAAQNYARHLQLVHKEEWKAHPGDLREAGEREVNFFQSKHNAGGKVVDQYGEKEADDDYRGAVPATRGYPIGRNLSVKTKLLGLYR